MIMRGMVAGILGLTLLSGALAGQEAAPVKPSVEVVFVLDTTGSMGGLIEGAKKKIWSIANTIASGKPTPSLSIGLVAYRDKGDAYVTRVSALTDDLDKVYADLTGFQAGGGGDGPENVRQALHDALTKIQWSKESKTLKIIFLVGDCPPHLDYQDVPSVEELCESAVKSDIIINTVRCGGHAETGRIWQQIARAAEGKFFSIDQSGGVVAVATPYDKDLSELSDKLGRTLVAYGGVGRKKEAEEAETAAREMAAPAKADRACAKAAMGYMSSADLVDAVADKRVRLEELKDGELPEEMRKMSLSERKDYVAKKAEERRALRAKVVELSKQREAYIAAELKKRGVRDAFDQVVGEALCEQAREKGIDIDRE